MKFRLFTKLALSTFLTSVSFFAGPFAVQAFAQGNCQTIFLATLQANDPAGFQVWNSLSDPSKSELNDLIQCQPDGSVGEEAANTLVHESIHLLDNEKSNQLGKTAYLLTNGQWISFQEDSQAWDYDYTRGQALKVMSTSERQILRAKDYLYDLGYESFAVLLDELNAYTHGLETSLHFPQNTNGSVDERDGPLEMMVFSLRYLEAMKLQSPDYYQTLITNNELMNTIEALFGDAYDVYNQSCARTDLNLDDQRSIDALNTAASLETLKTIFGSGIPAISQDCLATAKSMEQTETVPVNYPTRENAPSISGPGVTILSSAPTKSE